MPDTRSWRRRLIAVLVAFAICPGASELVSDVVLLVTHGHTFHAGHTEEHEHEADAGESPEHGCSGTVHLCGCCPSLSVVPTLTFALAHIKDTARPTPPADRVHGRVTDAHPQPPFRPPAA